MNQFTKLLQQAQSLVSGMNAQGKTISGLLILAILASVGMLVSGQSSRSKEHTFLFDGERFSEEQLGKFELALSVAKLKEWKRVDGRIQIPEDKKADYYRAIDAAKVSPTGFQSFVTSQLKDSNFLEPTRTTEAKYMDARLTAIANSIRAMPFVQNAVVNYDSQREGFSSRRDRVASIGIQPRNGVPLTTEQARNIMQYVQNGIAGLRPGDICLTDLASSRTWVGDDDTETLQQERFYQMKKQQEQDLKQRAEYLLADYGSVRVMVGVELDPVLSREVSQVNYDPKPTTVQSSTSRKDTDSQRTSPGGRPGTEPNALANRSASISQSPDQISKGKELTENTKQVVGSTLSTIREAGLQTKQVSLSVLVPISYYRTAFLGEWQQLNPARGPEEAPPFDEAALATTRLKVESNIKNVLSTIAHTSTPGEDKQLKITVGEYIDFPPTALEEPSFSAQAFGWLTRSWQTLVLAVIALVAIVSLRNFAKTTNVADTQAFENGFDIPLDDALDIHLTGLTDDDSEMSPRLATDTVDEPRTAPRFRSTGPDLKTELTSMVRENPDAAATLLRNWIGGAQG